MGEEGRRKLREDKRKRATPISWFPEEGGKAKGERHGGEGGKRNTAAPRRTAKRSAVQKKKEKLN